MLGHGGTIEELRAFIGDFQFPMVVTRGTLVVAVNDAWLSILGFRRGEVEGKPYVELMPEEERTRIRRRAELRAANPETVRFTSMTSLALKADGKATTVYVAPTVIPTADGEPFVLNFLFVAGERDAEVELAELLVAASSELASARSVLEVRRQTAAHLGEGGYAAVFVRPDGAVVYPQGAAVPTACRLSDLEEASTSGRPVFVGPETGAPSAVVVPIRQGDDAELITIAGPRLATPLRAALKLFAHGVGSALDTATLIVDLERQNRELSATRAELLRHERLASLGEMAAGIAHEVRNPVGVISNAVATLRRQVKADAASGELLEIIDEECLRLARMVRDLLDFANPRLATFTLEALEDIAEEAVAAVASQPDAVLRATRFQVERTGGAARVRVDRHMLRQAIVNLLVNAAQASARDAVVVVRVGMTKQGDREVPYLAVVDHGSGVPAPIADRIFEPFFTTRAQGTGLGLAVVKGIVEALHGEIRVEATPEHGATFTLVFEAGRDSGGGA